MTDKIKEAVETYSGKAIKDFLGRKSLYLHWAGTTYRVSEVTPKFVICNVGGVGIEIATADLYTKPGTYFEERV